MSHCNWKELASSMRILKLIFSSVQLLSHVRLFVTPWTAACQAFLSITNSRSLPKLILIYPVGNYILSCIPQTTLNPQILSLVLLTLISVLLSPVSPVEFLPWSLMSIYFLPHPIDILLNVWYMYVHICMCIYMYVCVCIYIYLGYIYKIPSYMCILVKFTVLPVSIVFNLHREYYDA